MDIFLHVDLNIFMMMICMIMYFSCRSMNEKQMVHQQIFRLLILSNFALLALESVTWMLDGRATPALIVLYSVVTVFLYLLTPVPAALGALYVSCQQFHDTQRLKREVVLFGIPIIVSSLITLITPLTGIWFTIDSANVYRRGALYPIFAVLSFWPVLYATVSILVHRRRLSKKFRILMLLFMVPPVIGTAVQVLYYGITLLWSSITISIFLVYSNMQNDQIYVDHLTGVFNRRQLDTLLSDRIRSARNNVPLSCVMLDIDHFKKINDTLGHVSGDEALKDASAILKGCIRKGDFLARFGGDEFVILTDIDNEAALKDLSERIGENVRKFNRMQQRPYTLDFSVGYAIYDPNSNWNMNDFISYVDNLMYLNKTAGSDS